MNFFFRIRSCLLSRVAVLLLVATPLAAQSSTSTFAFADRGGVSRSSPGTAQTLSVGSVGLRFNGAIPEGLALFGLRENAALVSEVSVPAANLINAGRIYAEVGNGVDTGIAIVNSSNAPVDVAFYFTDESGMQRSADVLTIPPKGQISKFLSQAPFNGGAAFRGTFTFFTLRNDPYLTIGAVALRGFVNSRGEFMMTTLPVTPVGERGLFSGNTIPHFASGSGWSSEVILVNPTDTDLDGTISFIDTAGSPAIVGADAGTGSSFAYRVARRSSFRLKTAATGSLLTGSVRLSPSRPQSESPVSFVLFSLQQNGVTVAETGVPPARSSSASRIFVEGSGLFDAGQAGSLGTAIAISNADSFATTDVSMDITGLNGISNGFHGTLSIPPGGQVARFLNQIPGFESLPSSFQGVLRMSTSNPVTVMGLRMRYNERQEFLVTTSPPVSENDSYFDAALRYSDFVFPIFADGGGYTTQFILFSGWMPGATNGTFEFLTNTGTPYPITLQ